MLSCHLEPLLTRVGQELAIYCEQAGKAIHHKFKGIKSLYKRNKYHAMHGKAQCSTWNLKGP